VGARLPRLTVRISRRRAALFGLAFGGLAVLAHARDRWRTTAVVGVAINSLALLVAVGEVVYFVVAG
jgi:hypothetical protein